MCCLCPSCLIVRVVHLSRVALLSKSAFAVLLSESRYNKSKQGSGGETVNTNQSRSLRTDFDCGMVRHQIPAWIPWEERSQRNDIN
jgi:hypothetical protein